MGRAVVFRGMALNDGFDPRSLVAPALRAAPRRLSEGMSKRPESPANKTSRDDRLRAALRANLARRKAQSRARAADSDAQGDEAADNDSAAEPNQEN